MERVLHDLAHSLPEHGFEVHIIVVEAFGRFATNLDRVATLHQVPPMSKFSLIHPAGLTSILRRIAPDIVHSHAGIWYKASLAARRARIPVVVHTEHGRRVPDPWTDRLLDNLASRWTDVTIAVSDALAKVLRRRVLHPAARLATIVNGVDVDRLTPPHDVAALRLALGIPPDQLVIGSVGRLQPIKNYLLALRALARLAPGDGSGPVLLLVGDGIERPMLEAEANRLGVAANVCFLGWRDDVAQVAGTFDLFTLTSLNEGTSVSLLEAMSCGCCPVVTDVGGNRAALGPDLADQLVPSGDAEALASAWARLLADPALRQRLSARARARVVEYYSLRGMVDAHVRLYRELVRA